MPNEHGHWRADERDGWKPDAPCPTCGSENLRPGWQDVMELNNGAEQWYIPVDPGCLECQATAASS